MERLTIDLNGFGWTGDSGQASISDDGRYVAVSTVALEDPIDTGQRSDIYLIDRQSGTFSMVSLNKDGQAPSANSLHPVPSSDASLMAFFSTADDLVPGQSGQADNVFVSEPGSGMNEVVTTPVGSLDTNGTAFFNSDNFSGDGRYVGFYTTATDLSALDNSSALDVYLADRTSDTRTLVSLNSAGEIGNNHSIGGSLSDNGRYVVFYSFATNLSADATYGVGQVFLRDTVDASTRLISTSSTREGGGQAHSSDSQISANGKYVVYLSAANDLVAGDNNDAVDLFLWNRASNQTTRIEISDIANSTRFDISDDGRYVVFDTVAALVGTDTNATRDIYVYDRVTDTTALVSQSDGGAIGDGLSVQPSISGDGKTIVFQSKAQNLTDQSADSTNWTDVYATANPLFSAPSGPNVIDGTNGKDILTGTGSKDIISGFKKADILKGKAGADVLKGGKGNDILNGGKGGDDLLGGKGNDTASYAAAGKEVTASLSAPGSNKGEAKGDSYAKVENLKGSKFGDKLTGNNDNNKLEGLKGADILIGNAGGDILRGGKGADVLKGQLGKDRLVGEAGNDTLLGGIGRDKFVFAASQGNDVIRDFMVGTDRLVLKGGMSILSLSEVDTDASGSDDAILVDFTGGGSVLLENILGVTDTGDLL